LTKLLTTQWNNLSAKEKGKYEKMHEDDKKRYEAEKEAAGESTLSKA
jgi:hypothetical protein